MISGDLKSASGEIRNLLTVPTSTCTISTNAQGEITLWFIGASSNPAPPVCETQPTLVLFASSENTNGDEAFCYDPQYVRRFANSSQQKAKWAPPGPSNLTAALLTRVTAMSIPNGVKASLIDKITALLTGINNNALGMACEDLRALSNQVTAQAGKQIAAIDAATIQQWVGYIARALPGCHIP